MVTYVGIIPNYYIPFHYSTTSYSVPNVVQVTE